MRSTTASGTVNSVVPLAGTKRSLIANVLATEIMEGKYAVGNALPSENELAQSFGVSRHTIRVAMTTLHGMGLIASQRGVGNIVRANSVPVRYAQSFHSLPDLLQYAANTQVEITDTTTITVDDTMAEWLDCKPGERWWCIATTRFSRDKSSRVACSEIFIPYMFGSVLAQKDSLSQQGGTILMLIESMLGKSIVEITQDITATKANETEAAALAIAPGDPVLCIARRYYGPDGQLLEATRSLHPEQSFRYSMRVRLAHAGMEV